MGQSINSALDDGRYNVDENELFEKVKKVCNGFKNGKTEGEFSILGNYGALSGASFPSHYFRLQYNKNVIYVQHRFTEVYETLIGFGPDARTDPKAKKLQIRPYDYMARRVTEMIIVDYLPNTARLAGTVSGPSPKLMKPYYTKMYGIM